MKQATPPTPDSDALMMLAREVDRMRSELADLGRLRHDVQALARGLADLARTTSGGNIPGGDTPAPDWLSVDDPGLAVVWLSGVHAWTGRVWCRYPDVTLPDCWLWHPSVVAELLVGWQLWIEATYPGAECTALGVWHDRWRTGVNSRISKALSGCERTPGHHVNRSGVKFTYNVSYLDELASWWATANAAAVVDLDSAPGLTPATHPNGDRARRPPTTLTTSTRQ
jgi:hypothetical protein